ncbi:MAG: hypothetical protein KC912_14580 [Proteobacteria bacterium]|nr:hypothetical protein [Pseudomonadota bacterium]
MIARILDDIRTAPERLNNKRVDLSQKLRQTAHTARGTTSEKVFDVRIHALTRVESLLDLVDELPVLKLVTAPAHGLAADRLAKAKSPALENYDELNAKDVRTGISGLTRTQVIALIRYEADNKARKTVIAAGEKAIERLDKLPEPVAAVAAA